MRVVPDSFAAKIEDAVGDKEAEGNRGKKYKPLASDASFDCRCHPLARDSITSLFFDVRLTRCLLSLLQFDVRLTPCFLSLVRVDYRSNQADDYYESRENHGDDLDAPPVIHLFSLCSCITRWQQSCRLAAAV
jgi:hypothetical protein